MAGGAQVGIAAGDLLRVQRVRVVAFGAGVHGFGMHESASVGFTFVLETHTAVSAGLCGGRSQKMNAHNALIGDDIVFGQASDFISNRCRRTHTTVAGGADSAGAEPGQLSSIGQFRRVKFVGRIVMAGRAVDGVDNLAGYVNFSSFGAIGADIVLETG